MTENGDTRTATIDERVTAAREYTTDHEQLADQFRAYLEALADVDRPKPANPLWPADEPNATLLLS